MTPRADALLAHGGGPSVYRWRIREGNSLVGKLYNRLSLGGATYGKRKSKLGVFKNAKTLLSKNRAVS